MPIPRSIEVDASPAEWLTRFIDDIPTGIALFDRDLRYVAANAVWCDTFRIAASPVAGRRHVELDPRGSVQLAQLQQRALAGETLSGGTIVESDAGLRHRTISVRPQRDGAGAVSGIVAALHEMAPALAARTAADEADPLTGIAGRDRFLARLRTALLPPGAPGPGTPIFLLDIVDFTAVNDLHGTLIGDRVLKTIAARLLTGVRSRTVASERPALRPEMAEADLVARLDGDEFGVVLGGPLPSLADAEAFARRLLELIEHPVLVGDQRIRLTANVGFVVTGPAHRSEDDLLRDLNIALREAKSHGPNSAKAWQPALAGTVGRRLAMLDQLRRALDENEFVLHYQPILSFADDRVVGAEALLRWNHPSDGLVAPADFLPLLEESGLIVPVGAWVIREAVRQMQVWQMLYGRDMIDWVAVNVSARQFNDPSLLLATLSEINDSGFPLDRLKLEITESTVMRNPAMTRAVLDQVREFGIRIALDDFGTGYSALGVLRHYSVDAIKIDREFTARLDTVPGRELMLAMLKIARIHGAVVIAEGVETSLQRDMLRAAGCDFAQGYLFAQPMDGSFFGAYALTHLVDGVAAVR